MLVARKTWEQNNEKFVFYSEEDPEVEYTKVKRFSVPILTLISAKTYCAILVVVLAFRTIYVPSINNKWIFMAP
jgi:hypothetical protein